MPQKPQPKKTTINVVVNGKPVAVILHPPTGRKKTWYAYWTGLSYSISTGHRNLNDAITAADNMLRNGGTRSTVSDTLLSDEEFVKVQRQHFAKPQDPKEKEQAAKSLVALMEAIEAFHEITHLNPITGATAGGCEQFQVEAVTKQRNWRSKPKTMTEKLARTKPCPAKHGSKQSEQRLLSPNTVDKWSRSLQAGFERVNRNGDTRT